MIGSNGAALSALFYCSLIPIFIYINYYDILYIRMI